MTIYESKSITFNLRGRGRTVRIYPQVFAVKVEDNDGVARDVADGGYGAIVKIDDFAHGGAEMRRAGWYFIAPSAADLATLAGKAGVLVGRVVTEADYRAKLDMGSLTVAFKKGLDRGRIDAALAQSGLQVVRPYGFIPNGFSVRTPVGGDAIAAVVFLLDHPDVEWAEPNFVEVIAPRTGMNGPHP